MENKKQKYAMSRRKRNSLLMSAFLLLAALIWTDKTFHPLLKTSVTTQITDSNDWEKYHQKNFTVVKVVDGDTIDIDLPDGKYKNTSPVRDKTSMMSDGRLGRPVSNGTRLRLLGVDTPETAKSPKGEMYYGPEASQFTKDMVLGKNVVVLMDRQANIRDKYGRLLCYIKLPDGRILNEELISNGFAYAYTIFKHPDFEKYIELEKTAERNKKGLWEKVTIEQMPQWRQK